MGNPLAVCKSLLSVPRSLPCSPSVSPLLHALKGSRTWYHSEHHPDPAPFPPAQTAILSATLNRVPEYGFSSKALLLGAKDAGYLEVSVQLFPRGAFDLINYHLVTQRLALKDRVQFPADANLDVRKKVRVLTLERLMANSSIIHQWQGVSQTISTIFDLTGI
jgi:ubiquinone biosynthesis protein COQ9